MSGSGPHIPVQHVSRARRAWGDVIIVGSLLNELRHRLVTGVSGASRGDSNLLTLFVLAALASGLRRAAAAPRTQVRKARSSPTAVGDTVMGTAVAKEAVASVAGPPTRNRPFAVGLIVFAVVVHFSRPAVERAVRTAWAAYRSVMAELRRVWAAIRRFGI